MRRWGRVLVHCREEAWQLTHCVQSEPKSHFLFRLKHASQALREDMVDYLVGQSRETK